MGLSWGEVERLRRHYGKGRRALTIGASELLVFDCSAPILGSDPEAFDLLLVPGSTIGLRCFQRA